MKLLCFNVNGIRAVWTKGFEAFLDSEQPDALCIQESKIQEAQLTQAFRNPVGYFSEWVCAKRPGYSGVTTFSKVKALSVQKELGNGRHDDEGRLLLTQIPAPELPGGTLTLVNVYIPNGGMGDHRIEFKLDYYDEMLLFLERLRKEGHNLVICGDFNTAHMEIDLARPAENETVTGFLPVERAWIDQFIAAGYVDTFRALNPDVRDAYTWWSYRTAARQRNIGWRIDYFFVAKELLPFVKRAWILSDIQGSDHCPIGLELGPPSEIKS